MNPPTPDDKTWGERFRLSRMMFAAILRTGDKVDELSTWVLGATGGITALTVADREHINAALKPGWELVRHSASRRHGLRDDAEIAGISDQDFH
jgi:hypothetical protein